MILALDDDVPTRVSRRIRAHEAVHDLWTIRLGRALSAERARPLIPDGLDATLVLVRHGEIEAASSRAGSRARPRRRCRRTGRRQAGARRRAAWPTPHAPPALPVPTGAAARARPLAARSDDRRPPSAHRRSAPSRRQRDRPRRPDAGFLEIGQGDWEGLHRDEIDRPLRRRARGRGGARPTEVWAPGGESLPRSQARVRPALGRRSWPARRRAGAPGTLDRPQVAGLRRRAGPTTRGRSSSATTASSRSRC